MTQDDIQSIYIHTHTHAQMTQDEIEAARVERTVHAGVSSAKKNAICIHTYTERERER